MTLTKTMTPTVDELIEQLTLIRDKSSLGGETCVVISLTGSELEPLRVYSVALVPDSDGATVELRTPPPEDEDLEWALRNLSGIVSLHIGSQEIE